VVHRSDLSVLSRETYLAGTQGFTIKDTLCSDLEVRRVGIDDYGRLPA
jgi:hypothetical protein